MTGRDWADFGFHELEVINLIIGMDFGTTNSGMSLFDGREVHLLPLDPANTNPRVIRTALYLTNDQSITIGREAINRYFEENVGRPVKMQKVWVGEVEVYGADMYYVTDVYAWSDVLSPGRLFLSIKSGLRDPEYQGTVVGSFFYSLENLIAIYMTMAKARAERILGREVRQVALGRPVRFSSDPQADKLAEQRLLEAAFRAGFEKVYLQFEPVAAAYHYAAGVHKPQNILIFDFGGGTLDITVMRLDGNHGRKVLATGGIAIAGDVFDQRLVRARLPKHFGEDGFYGPQGRRLPMPKWVFDVFSNWQTIIELQTPESSRLLREIAQTADDQRDVEALISLVANNYSLQMFDVVESAKRKLSSDMATVIRLHGPGFKVTEMVTRSQFEKIIRAEIQTIERHLDETVATSGLAPRDIDAVIRTGGSSQIPVFRYMLMEKFGRDKVLESDIFSSVTSGLGIIAFGITAGEIEAQAHTPSTRRPSSQSAVQQQVKSVNLDLLKRRIAVHEKEGADRRTQKRKILILLADGGRLLIKPLSDEDLGQETPLPWPEDWRIHELSPINSAMATSLDERLLMVTSRYRFLLTSAGHLLDLQEMGLDVPNFFQFMADEQLCAVGPWQAIKQMPKLLLVTSRGFARTFNLNGLIEQIEGPVPYKFEQPLPGLPIFLSGAQPDHYLIIILDSGRSVRYCLQEARLQGLQAINRREGERIVSAVVAENGNELVLATADGYGRRLLAEAIPIPNKPNVRGRALVSRRPVCGLARVKTSMKLWAITSRHLLEFQPGSLPLDPPNSTKSHRLIKLTPGEKMLAIFNF